MLGRLDPRHWLARCVRCGCPGGELCGVCAEHPLAIGHTPRGLLIQSVGRYAGHLAECIRRLKYHDETHLAFPLGRALRTLTHDSALFEGSPSVIPVPLHATRLAERGYNQSALVARHFASSSGARVVTSCLFRREARKAQAQLSASERRSNVLGAFQAQPLGRAGARSAVLLLDDVVTTGSTIDACAAALERIGVTVQGVLSCALAGDD